MSDSQAAFGIRDCLNPVPRINCGKFYAGFQILSKTPDIRWLQKNLTEIKPHINSRVRRFVERREI